VHSDPAVADGRIFGGLAAGLLLALWPFARAEAAPSQALDQWRAHVSEASHRFGVPAQWIRRVMRTESGGRTMLHGRPITSRAGAMGLMQLMPGTWAEMRDLHGLGSDPHEPRDNILAGTAYLRAMYERFGYPGLFAAYNAGPKRYATHLATGRPLPAETVAYVAAVARSPKRVQLPKPRSRTGSVFVALAGSPTRQIGAVRTMAADSLFVRLSAASTEFR
jgi:soluble lytic murein transglycosylase-like protein